jgi:DNA-directed RNA polymerase specialized sigma24 family protein
LQLQKDVRKWVKQLPFEIKQVVIMRTFLDLSFKEIAEKTGLQTDSIYKTLHEGIKKLKGIL